MKQLSNKQLIEAYEKAVILQLDFEFCDLLWQEMSRRSMVDKEHIHAKHKNKQMNVPPGKIDV